MILLRPSIISFKNNLKKFKASWTTASRDIIVLASMFFLSFVIFIVMKSVLTKVLSDENFITIPADILLILCFNIFMPMIFFTNLTSFLGNFFNSEDLELLLSSPMSKLKFFTQRTIVCAIESSWMTVFSLVPFLLSIYACYNTSIFAYIALPFTLGLFLLIPATLASVIGIIWSLLVPKIPPGFLILFIFSTAIYLITKLISIMNAYLTNELAIDSNLIITLFTKLESFGRNWSPGTWTAKGLAGFFYSPSSINANAYFESGVEYGNGLSTLAFSLIAGITTILFISSIGFLLFINFYPHALSSMWGRKKKVLYSIGPISNKLFEFTNKLLPKSQQLIGLIKKETIEIARDSTQIVQILFLISFFSLYLYALQFEQIFQNIIGTKNDFAWKQMISGLNFAIECFMMVAMALRLSFPSISKEGRGIWLMRVSPINPKIIIKAKLIVLASPIIISMGILSFFSSFLSTNNTLDSLMKASFISVASLSICSLSMYLGAVFANFSWESRSQLIASVGSLIFMMSGITFSFINIALSIPLQSIGKYSNIGLISYWIGIILFNLIISKLFIKLSAKNLEKRLTLGDY